MFILRRVDPEAGQINTNLGDYYTLILKESHPKQFEKAVKHWDADVVKKMYGAVVFDDDNELIMPLYNGSQYYVMASDGRTFDNVSPR